MPSRAHSVTASGRRWSDRDRWTTLSVDADRTSRLLRGALRLAACCAGVAPGGARRPLRGGAEVFGRVPAAPGQAGPALGVDGGEQCSSEPAEVAQQVVALGVAPLAVLLAPQRHQVQVDA